MTEPLLRSSRHVKPGQPRGCRTRSSAELPWGCPCPPRATRATLLPARSAVLLGSGSRGTEVPRPPWCPQAPPAARLGSGPWWQWEISFPWVPYTSPSQEKPHSLRAGLHGPWWDMELVAPPGQAGHWGLWGWGSPGSPPAAGTAALPAAGSGPGGVWGLLPCAHPHRGRRGQRWSWASRGRESNCSGD